MAASDTPTVHSDIDILERIQLWLMSYPPAVNDRPHLHIAVEDGIARISGSVKTPITRSFLVQHLGSIEGVRAVDASELYDDETIRLTVGTLLPYGIIANVEWGLVVLSGKLPAEDSLQDLVAQIAAVPGVKRVVVVG